MRVEIPTTGYFGQIRSDMKESVLQWLNANVGAQIRIEDSHDGGDERSLSQGHRINHIGNGWRYHKMWLWMETGTYLPAELLDRETVYFDDASSAIMFKLAAPWEDAISRWEI